MRIMGAGLWLVAAAGHFALCVYAVNWLQSTRFRGWWMKLLRRLVHVANVGLPLWLLWQRPGLLEGLTEWWTLPPALLAYLVGAALVGGGYLPMVLIRRWRRRPPVHQLSNRVKIIRPAQRLGYVPYGRGKHGWLAYLPGNEIFEVEITHRELLLPRLPSVWEGLTVLHLSDTHFCGVPDLPWFEHVMDELATVEADLLLITGDIVDSGRHYHWIAPLLSRLRWRYGAFAVLGNHDSYLDAPRIRRALLAVGIEPIGGQWRQVDIQGQPLILIGTELPWLRPGPDLTGLPEAGFRLCLSHAPDQLAWCRRQRIDLMLAGHCHGGQIRFPGIGSVFVPSRFSGRYDAGLFWEPPTLMHVSRGLAGTYPVRYRCRPEVTWLTLRAPQLHHDAAGAKQFMQTRPPAFTIPFQTGSCRDVAQL